MKWMIALLSLHLFRKKTLISLTLFAVLALIIWFAGPHLKLGIHHPLYFSSKRLYAILLVGLIWVIKNNIGLLQFKKNRNQGADPKLTEKQKALEDRFLGAIRFLKKTLITRKEQRIKLYQLPWYILIGQSGAGKTSLLANANIHFLLSKKYKTDTTQSIAPSQACDWWVTRDLAVIDVPGTYLHTKPKIAEIASHHGPVLWQNFLKLVKKYRGRQHKIKGVLIALSLPELSENPKLKKKMIEELRARISDLRGKFGRNLSFHFILTKCDLLPGFAEYFSNNGTDELSQAWGTCLTKTKDNNELITTLTSRLNAVIRRLNKQLLWRLHQERNPNIRNFIKDFPYQVELVKENFVNVIKEITRTEKNVQIRGVYLTSATQELKQAMTTYANAEGLSQTALKISRGTATPHRPYFIRHLFLREFAHNTPIQTGWQRFVIPILALTVTLFTCILANDLRVNVESISSIQGNLSRYQTQAQNNPHADKLTDVLPLLNTLQDTAEKSPHSVLMKSNIRKNANYAYFQSLQTLVLPEINNSLEKFLQSPANKNSEDLYDALKAYLMLGNAQHLQPEFVVNTLRHISPQLFDDNSADALVQHLKMALNTVWQPTNLDTDLISASRSQLTHLSPLELSQLILNTSTPRKMNDESLLFIGEDTLSQIPSIYSAATFQDTYNQKINNAVNVATSGNWVLGSINSSTKSVNLAQQVRNDYITNYAKAWENLLANTQLFRPTNLTETDALIQNLISDNSPLQMLRTIHQNTSFAPIMAVSAKLAALNDFFAKHHDIVLNKTLAVLTQLHHELEGILTAQDVHQAAFLAATIHAKNANNSDVINQLFALAEQNPAPLKGWLNEIATLSLRYMLQESVEYIQSQWQNEIMANYDTQFANRYPFYPNDTNEVALSDFTKLLAPHGQLDTFYDRYLAPFVDNTQQSLQWKMINGLQIPLSTALLAQLDQASLIQNAFFPIGSVEPTIKFTLQPRKLDPHTHSIHINMNGEILDYERRLPRNPQTLSWPNNNTTHQSSITVTTATNQTINTTVTGDWSWFRIINQATTKIFKQKVLVLSFNVEGHMAKYLLFPKGRTNPFISLNMQAFHLPTTIAIQDLEQKA